MAENVAEIKRKNKERSRILTEQTLERIAVLSEDHGTSIWQVSRDCKIPNGTVNNWKNRGNNPNCFDLFRIAEHFGVSMDYLYQGKSPVAIEELSAAKQYLILFAFKSSDETIQDFVKFLEGFRADGFNFKTKEVVQ